MWLLSCFTPSKGIATELEPESTSSQEQFRGDFIVGLWSSSLVPRIPVLAGSRPLSRLLDWIWKKDSRESGLSLRLALCLFCVLCS